MTTDRPGGGELTDGALQDEIELVGELVVAASASERPLTDDEIDQVLGIQRAHRDQRDDATGHRIWRRQDA
jgi:hypothetical protein